jgi:hypothetical protein
VPADNALVTHVAELLTIETLEHPVIEVPSAVKLIVPVAPLVTVAVKVSYPPITIEFAETVSVVVDAFPG